MTEELVLQLTQNTLVTIAKISGPILLISLGVGLLVSLFQALTQINEATLSFIPKLIVVGLIIALAGGWMLDVLTQYTREIFENIPQMVRSGL
ncbi:MAG: flagellar biosynthesis protein FliQ [Bdellovibrionaceae bacterium]|jgi:flagellar biosynthetic protein FliQ|nr:flagellar biosynthesis protein FliQ [Pseudobdellovibrionaceae bacterium]